HRPGAAAWIHRAHRGARARAPVRRAEERTHMSVDELTVPTSAAPGGAPPVGKHADRFVIFGITGDLAKVMTFRSLYRLERRGLLDCPIVGVAVNDWTVEQLIQRARESIVGTGETIDEDVFKRFASRLSYVSGDFGEASTFERVG